VKGNREWDSEWGLCRGGVAVRSDPIFHERVTLDIVVDFVRRLGPLYKAIVVVVVVGGNIESFPTRGS